MRATQYQLEGLISIPCWIGAERKLEKLTRQISHSDLSNFHRGVLGGGPGEYPLPGWRRPHAVNLCPRLQRGHSRGEGRRKRLFVSFVPAAQRPSRLRFA